MPITCKTDIHPAAEDLAMPVTYRRTLTLLDNLGKEHDRDVHRWKENLEETMVVAQVSACRMDI